MLVNKLLSFIEESQRKLGLASDARKEALEKFCDEIFGSIVEEDLSIEKITILHAIQFNTTADIIEVLSSFGPLTPDWEEKRRYCRYKAILIYKCIKSKIDMPRGRPNDAPETFVNALACAENNMIQIKPGSKNLKNPNSMILGTTTTKNDIKKDDNLDNIVIPNANKNSMISILNPKEIEGKQKDLKDHAKIQSNQIVKPSSGEGHMPSPDDDVIIPFTHLNRKHEAPPTVAFATNTQMEATANLIKKEVECALGELNFKNPKNAKEFIKRCV